MTNDSYLASQLNASATTRRLLGHICTHYTRLVKLVEQNAVCSQLKTDQKKKSSPSQDVNAVRRP